MRGMRLVFLQSTTPPVPKNAQKMCCHMGAGWAIRPYVNHATTALSPFWNKLDFFLLFANLGEWSSSLRACVKMKGGSWNNFPLTLTLLEVKVYFYMFWQIPQTLSKIANSGFRWCVYWLHTKGLVSVWLTSGERSRSKGHPILLNIVTFVTSLPVKTEIDDT